MAVLAAAQIYISWIATFKPRRLGNRFDWNRIERKTCVGRVIDTVTFAGILELHRIEIGVGNVRHYCVGHAVYRKSRAGVTAEVGMKSTCATVVDESNVVCGIRIHRPTADIQMPPIISRKERQR